MMKRSFFLSLAAGLLVSLAFTTPSQAGGTLVTTIIELPVLSPSATSIVLDYSTATGPISGVGGLITSLTGVSVAPTGPEEVTVSFSPAQAGPGNLSFTFDSPVPFANSPGTISLNEVTVAPGGQMVTTHLSFSLSTVPEPSSMALLGIGMTGFLAFRRLFKRVSVA
jgi:PEP-CTERM motif